MRTLPSPVWDGQELRQVTMAEYLPGVVRGEMPAAFSQQALDAQAVAERTSSATTWRADVRTPTRRRMSVPPGLLQRLRIAGGRSGPVGGQGGGVRDQVQQAVRDYDGQIILYDGSPILAAFHSSSAGVTADSGDVWSSSLPYLHSVETPEGEDSVPNYYSRQHLLPGGVPGDLSGGPWGCRPLRRPGGVVPGSDGQRLRPGGACDHRRRQRGGDGGAAAVLPALGVLHRGYGSRRALPFGSRASVTACGHEPVRS